jgi:hypothetical protein
MERRNFFKLGSAITATALFPNLVKAEETHNRVIVKESQPSERITAENIKHRFKEDLDYIIEHNTNSTDTMSQVESLIQNYKAEKYIQDYTITYNPATYGWMWVGIQFVGASEPYFLQLRLEM